MTAAATALVRVCPVCETENPPERVHCSVCASLLVDVDFSRPRSADVPAQPKGVTPPSPAAAEPKPQPLTCPDPDCGQPNPPGTTRCLYCDTPLQAAADQNKHAEKPAEPAPQQERPNAPNTQNARIRLPQELAARFNIVRELPVGGSEADLLLVEPKTPEKPEQEVQLLKLYRPGIHPDSTLLARLPSAGTHVIRIFGHGIADGLAWVLMEYCSGGNLREALRDWLMDWESFRQIARELAAGVTEIHALNILHRDLKPENVLVRHHNPFALVLTDFGIASLNEGTRIFTDTARTVKYAAPEALTGILDAKADWWSVGMILLEIASGRHPFAGLSEQVVNHHLATRPIEISGVAFDEAEKLCRGLLLRDPGRRWGAAEVERWLAGDKTLTAPIETGASLVRPYRLGEKSAHDAAELATLLAATPESWQAGLRDLKRGVIQEWIKNDLRDFNLSRELADIMDAHGETPDRKLLRFFITVAPELPPLWQGHAITRKTLMQAACLVYTYGKKTATTDVTQNNVAQNIREARIVYADVHIREKPAPETVISSEEARKAAAARIWLASILDNNVLPLFKHPELAELAHALQQTLAEIRTVWSEMRKAYETFQRRSDKEAGKHFVNFDSVVYGRDDTLDLPPLRLWYPVVVLALTRDAFLPALKHDIERAAQEVSEDAPWFAHLVITHDIHNVARTLVAGRLAKVARAHAGESRQKQHRQQTLRIHEIHDIQKRFVRTIDPFLDPPGTLDARRIEPLRTALARLHTQVTNVTNLNFPEKEFIDFSRAVEAIAHQSERLETALTELERTARVSLVATLPVARALLLTSFLILAALAGIFGVSNVSAPFFLLAGAGIAFPFWQFGKRLAAQRTLARQYDRLRRLCNNFVQTLAAEAPKEIHPVNTPETDALTG
jgi:serine/threonine protein kinase